MNETSGGGWEISLEREELDGYTLSQCLKKIIFSLDHMIGFHYSQRVQLQGVILTGELTNF